MKKLWTGAFCALAGMLLAGTVSAAYDITASGDEWTLEGNGTLYITGTISLEEEGWQEYDSQIKKVVLTADTGWIPEGVFVGCTALEEFVVEEGCTSYLADDGVLYQVLAEDSLNLVCYPSAKPDAEYTVLADCSIGDYAFSDAESLSRVTIPASVYYIGDYAFQNCTGLSHVVREDGLGVSCPGNVFDGCTSLDPAIIEEFCWDNPFTDVQPQNEYYDAVKFVHKSGLMNGTSDSQFSPDTGMTRAMFVTVLGRMAGVTEVYADVTFEDVEEGQWYTDYVRWAASTGLVEGYGNGKFGVNDKVTIEQAAVILARYAELAEIPAYDMEEDYTDAADISEWAEDAMRWAAAEEIYVGYGDELRPKQNAPRALVAQMLYNYSRAEDDDGERSVPTISKVSAPDWGLTLTASNVTNTGMTLTFTQSGGNPTGELQIGTDFYIEVGETEDWFPVENTINGWTAEALVLNMGGTTELVINWEYGYGKLPVGYYRIVKEVMDFRGSGDYDTAKFYAEFAVLENSVPSAKLDGFSHTELEQASVTYPGGKEVEVERDYIALFVNGSVVECENVYLQDGVPVVPAKLVCNALGIPYDANTMTEEMRADTLAETLGAEYRYFDTTDRKEPYLYLSGKHVMIDKFDDTLTAKTAEEAAAHLKEVLITAYETRFREDLVPAKSVVEGPAAPQNEQEWHRYHITAIDVDDISFELGRYYMIPYVWDFYVDKYTDDVYMMYNGIVNQITKYDPMSDGALTFAG